MKTIREKLKEECEVVIAAREKQKAKFQKAMAENPIHAFTWEASCYAFTEYMAHIAEGWQKGLENIKDDKALEKHLAAILARDIGHLLSYQQSNKSSGAMCNLLSDLEKDAQREWVEIETRVLGMPEFTFHGDFRLYVKPKNECEVSSTP